MCIDFEKGHWKCLCFELNYYITWEFCRIIGVTFAKPGSLSNCFLVHHKCASFGVGVEPVESERSIGCGHCVPSTHIMSAWCFLEHFEGSVAVVGSRRRFIPMTSGIACMSLWVFPVRRWLFETESLYVGICPPEVDQCDLVGSNSLLTWNWGRNVNGVQDCGPS